MLSLTRKLAIALFGIILTTSALADTRYISDSFFVPLRTGPGNQYRIIDNGLKSGTQLTILEADSGNGFSKVQTPSGKEGYVPTQYLQTSQTARQQLKQLQQQYSQANSQRQQQGQELSALKQQLSSSLNSGESQTKKITELSSELEHIKAISKDSLNLANRNEELVKETLHLKNELEALQVENERLSDASTHTWFLYGAGTVIGSFLLGVIAPMLRPRRRQSEWT